MVLGPVGNTNMYRHDSHLADSDVPGTQWDKLINDERERSRSREAQKQVFLYKVLYNMEQGFKR